MSVFKAYDVRGIYLDELDENLAYRIGFFLPKLLNTDRVMIGRDIRKSSLPLKESLMAGIVDAGADCLDLGLASTPYVYFSTIFSGMSASVQITASHNPKNYNGFKISGEKAFPIGAETGLKELENMVYNEEIVRGEKQGVSIAIDNTEAYINYQKRFLEDLSSLDISFDLSSGMSALFAKRIFGEESSNRHYINSELDGDFPSHSPNPLDIENCRMIMQEVVNNSSDVGVIFDGDADRVVFIDEKGRFIQPDYTTALIGKYYKDIAKKCGNVICDIRTSKSTLSYLDSIGFKTDIWKVGHSFAKRKMREVNGIFGGELAGHYYFRDFFFCDSGLHAAVLVLNAIAALKKEGKTFSQFMDEIIKYSNSGEMNYKIENKDAVIEAVREKYRHNALTVREFDGLRYDFGQWWFSLRKSNTEPYLRLIVEAQNDEMLSEKITDFEKIIRDFQ